MTIDAEQLMNWTFPVTTHTYSEKDSILYALGVGLGEDPLDERDLQFVYEKDLSVLPTMAAVLGHPGPWYRDPALGIDWVRVLQGEQKLIIHTPLAPADTLQNTTRVVHVEDKGPGRGALVRWQRRLTRAETGELVATSESVLFCRGDGGFGGERLPAQPVPGRPEGDPTTGVTTRIDPRAGLIYRLSGDVNPVHVEPKVAAQAGFDRPILHGLCTFAVAAWAVLTAVADGDPTALQSISARFKAPVYPGDVVRTDLWQDGEMVYFECVEERRNIVVLQAGQADVGGRRGKWVTT